jgi:hypothetical protein
MFTCKVCGRKFKSKDALGGHVSHAHPQNPPEAVCENDNPDLEAPEPEDESKAAEIREYIARGYNFEQLIGELHFPERSVRREWARRVQPASEAKPDQESNLPATYKQTELINPEALLRRYTDGSYEDELELRGMMKMQASILMVMELANIQKTMAEAEAKRLEPLLKVLREGREELDAAAARARGQSFEMAQEAAEGAVSRVLGYIDQKLPKGPPPKDMSEMFTKRIDKMWEMMEHMWEQRMFPGQPSQPPEGWEYRRESATPAGQAPSQSSAGAPAGWEIKHVKEENHVQSSDVGSEPSADGASEGGRQTPEDGHPQIPPGG